MKSAWLRGMTFTLAIAGWEVQACSVPVFRFALDRWSSAAGGEEAVESPVIRELAERILSGDSAVFVQVDSGDSEHDDAVFSRLEARLRFFESVAELPEIDPNDPASQLGPGPELMLRFSTIRLAADDPAVAAILGGDSLPENEAVVAPVFGRCRVLGAWPASLMDEVGIDEVCHFLIGACSCQVKAQNPGWDLATDLDWDERLFEIEQTRYATGTELELAGAIGGSEESNPSILGLETVAFVGTTESDSTAVRWIPYLAGGLLLGGGLWLLLKK